MMNLEEFSSLSKNYDALNEEQRLDLEKITYRYPYFQAAYALYLKSLKEQEKFNFDLILKKTAVISPERNTLYHWLYNEIKVIENKNTGTVKEEKETTNTSPKKVEEKSLPVNLSFLEWIEWTKSKSVNNIEDIDIENPISDKIELIDTFLKNKPKIPPLSSNAETRSLSEEIKFNKEELMTETLAKVYVKQGKFKKALLAYKILSLKYPEKNSFFANQIKAIKDLHQK
ncbi:MAG: hypothetical protein ACI94N_000111 [Candidatus Arcticimaribacter sp.]|jgi:hypothetical protein